MSAKRVLSVGQCGYDHGTLSMSLRQHFGAEVVPADSADEAVRRLQSESFDLVLVNRVFDTDGASGLEFIRGWTKQAAKVPVMLVSNYEEAQKEAVEAGALPGFGKSAVGQPAMISRLKGVLGA